MKTNTLFLRSARGFENARGQFVAAGLYVATTIVMYATVTDSGFRLNGTLKKFSGRVPSGRLSWLLSAFKRTLI